MKASRRRRIRSCQKRKIVRLPCPKVWLDASEVGLRFAGKDTRQYPGPHKRKSRFRSKEETRCRTALSKLDKRFTLLALSEWKKIRPGGSVRSGAEKQAGAENPLPGGLLKRPAEDADLGCEDLSHGSFHTVRVGVAVVAQAPPDLDAGALDEGGEVRHLVVLEGDTV